MPVQDHPRYKEWQAASDHLTEARERFKAAEKNGSTSEKSLAKRDLDKAQADYYKINLC